jgi:hypothetical protein
MSLGDCVVPDSLKERLHDKLAESKALEKIDHRIKQGMCAAIEILRGDKSREQFFETLGFDKGPAETKALQAIYKYLASVGLTWTLEAISQETNVNPTDTGREPSLTDLLQYPGGKPTEEVAESGEDGEAGGEEDDEATGDEEEEDGDGEE